MTNDQKALKKAAELSARQAGFTKDAVHVMPDGSDGWRSSPGKFEGEQWYAPYYYDVASCGDGESLNVLEDSSYSGDLIRVNADESEVFGLQCGHCVLVREDSQGFVMVTVHASTREAETKFNTWAGI
jgi:hypothetical protein